MPETVEDLVIGARGRSGEQARVRGDIIGAGVTTVRRIVVVVGLLVLADCLDWAPPRAGGDADGDADTDSDVDTDSDSEADQEDDADTDSMADGDADVDSDTDVDADTDTDADVDPCEGVTCSGHGRCLTERGVPVCVCDDGYRAVGLACVCDPDCDERECGPDSCGGECPPGCVAGEMCDEGTGLCATVEWCDGTSGLCWQDPPSPEARNWDSAVAYCNALDLGGHGPGSWHLPTVSELRSLIRGCPAIETGGDCGVTDLCLSESCSDGCTACLSRGGPGTDGAYWPAGVSGSVCLYWSSSSDAGSSSYAWVVNFISGSVYIDPKTNSRHVRCVRGGP